MQISHRYFLPVNIARTGGNAQPSAARRAAHRSTAHRETAREAAMCARLALTEFPPLGEPALREVSSDEYETVIGLGSCGTRDSRKIFCGCENKFGGEPNTHCCPGVRHAGRAARAEQVVEYAAKASLDELQNRQFLKMDRKGCHPTCPRLPDIAIRPAHLQGRLCGHRVGGETRRVRIAHSHGRTRASCCDVGAGTAVDYNRCGVPLIEIVTEPVCAAPRKRIPGELRSIEIHRRVGLPCMRVRCAATSTYPCAGGSDRLGTRTEMKNLNSFSAVFRYRGGERAPDRRLEEATPLCRRRGASTT